MKTSPTVAGTLAGVLALGLGVSFSTVSPALAQPAAATGAAASGQIGGQTGGQTGSSVAFVRDISNAGRFEVQSGTLALQRSQHAGVLGYAGQAVKDAGEMLGRVKSINTANKGASIPSGLTPEQQVLLARMSVTSGPDFDRLYMQSQIEIGLLLQKTLTDYGANGESETMRVYAAAAVTGYDAQILQARAIAGSL